ncbi:MAG: iron-containing alcohol dehydrogenase [Bacteroidetes bacterium]|jgi:NADP-dependent alcohol dehydrogenase|nr:iron-containing alcohol dehydrogenase [Bacteroidota bacterium]MDA8930635.1 iron-containing alcohol dehydrogenase [Bacteroidia bacterium]
MLNFELQNPVKILFGKDQIAKLPTQLPKDANILMLYGGGSIKKNGVYDQVVAALSDYNYTEFGGIPANPEYEVLMDALAIIKSEKIDFLLAVGGGSVIDGVKFLASAALYEGEEPWDILANGIRTNKGMPFGTVLTLPATGTEMNSGSVISRRELGEKRAMGGPGLFPKFSILDPTVVATIPKRQLANGITDAFTHVMEQYMTYPIGADLQDRFAESIMSSLIATAPKVMADPSDYTVAANFMWCCTMALNGLIQKGVPTDWAIHAMGHELTALYGIDHARTLAIIAPRHYTHFLENKKEKLALYGERVWNITEGTVEERAKAAIAKTEAFFHSMDIPTRLSDYTDQYAGTAEKVSETLRERGWVALGEHKAVTPEAVKDIVEGSY